MLIGVLSNLTPRFEPKGKIIVNELDEFGEVTFVYKGKVALGFEINKIKKFPFCFKNGCIIGAFNVSFS